uniref:Uncharacterized protein n=1 Tax=Romanomermis culicivorax TaxID=13658 RepID=A0A915L6V8_ROMCU
MPVSCWCFCIFPSFKSLVKLEAKKAAAMPSACISINSFLHENAITAQDGFLSNYNSAIGTSVESRLMAQDGFLSDYNSAIGTSMESRR